MHHYYVINGVDGAVCKKQAWDRLVDKRNGPEDSVVHQHGVNWPCRLECELYHNNVHTGEPESHSVAVVCSEPEEEEPNVEAADS